MSFSPPQRWQFVMPQKNRIFRHVLVIVAITIVSFSLCIYADQYSIHDVVTVAYDEFDREPHSSGLVVLEQGKTVDFRLPDTTLSSSTVARIHDSIKTDATTDSQLLTDCVALVRTKLNATDSTKPKAATADGETLYQRGMQMHCLCGEHAVLLNEILQVCGLQSRVLWLEGHVTAEYYDRQIHQWVFVDPHMNVLFEDSAGEPLSAAQLIDATERDQSVTPARICSEEAQPHARAYADIDHLWYRNVLLNGECYALSGTTLRDSSRWTHLARFRALPQMLVLATAYDGSHAKYIDFLSVRKCLLVAAALIIGFYILVGFLHRNSRPIP